MSIKLLIKSVIVLPLSFSILTAGGVKGTIKFEGKVPSMKPLNMNADQTCVALNSEEVRSEWLLVGDKGELKNVFVYVKEGIKEKYDPPAEHAVIDQKGCMYIPHVLGVQVGQEVDILNSDGTLHNVHSIPKVNREFNIAMPKFRKKLTTKFDQTEIMIPLKCDIHLWMGAWVGIMEHPFLSVIGEDGTFEISDVPDGTYTLEAWHERLGSQTAEVTITEGSVEITNFTFKKP